MEQVLSGWQDAMTKPNSISWLTARLRQQSVPRQAPG
jgi:hypothetical protein